MATDKSLSFSQPGSFPGVAGNLPEGQALITGSGLRTAHCLCHTRQAKARCSELNSVTGPLSSLLSPAGVWKVQGTGSCRGGSSI